jgi:hypothetical protein
METVTTPETLGIIGVVTVRHHPSGTTQKLEQLHAEGRHDEAQRLLCAGTVASKTRNTVLDSTDCGIDLIRQWFISGYLGFITYPVGPQWGEIGTGNTTPTTTDTSLEAPVARARISYATNSGGVSSLHFFFSDAQLPNQTYREFMTIVAGDATLGSGQGVNRVLFGTDYSKTGGNDTTVQVDFTIANV